LILFLSSSPGPSCCGNHFTKVDDAPLAYLNTDANFDGISFYMTAARKKIVKREKGQPRTDRFYICDDVDYPGFHRKILWRFDTKYKKNQVLVTFTKRSGSKEHTKSGGA
jgi:hypothetical protein